MGEASKDPVRVKLKDIANKEDDAALHSTFLDFFQQETEEEFAACSQFAASAGKASLWFRSFLWEGSKGGCMRRNLRFERRATISLALHRLGGRRHPKRIQKATSGGALEGKSRAIQCSTCMRTAYYGITATMRIIHPLGGRCDASGLTKSY